MKYSIASNINSLQAFICLSAFAGQNKIIKYESKCQSTYDEVYYAGFITYAARKYKRPVSYSGQ